MKKKFLLVSVVVCGGYFVNVSAQGYLTDTRTSNAMQLRDPARQASLEVDAAVVNPAGTAFMNDGLHISASGFASFGAIDTKENEGKNMSETKATRWLPAMQLVYKKDRWAVSASFANEGGFGRYKSDKGSLLTNGMFEDMLGDAFDELSGKLSINGVLWSVIDVLLGNNMGFDYKPEDRLAVTTNNMKLTEYNRTVRAGMSCRLTDGLSVYFGAKANFVSSKGATDIGFAVFRPSTGEYINYKDYYSFDRDAIAGMDIDDDIKQSLLDLVENQSKLAGSMESVEGSADYSLSGWGVAPVIGVDYKTGSFNFGAKYEFASHIDAKKANDFNIPALLFLGGSWQCNDRLKFALGGNMVFNEEAKFGYIADSSPISWDVAASATYGINDKITISGGFTLGSSNYEVPGFPTSYIGSSRLYCQRLSLGAAWNVMENMQVNAGVGVDMSTKSTVTYTGSTNGKCSYDINPTVLLALGVNYSF